MPDFPVLRDLLSRDLIRFSPDTTIVDAVAQMIAQEISGAPVVDNDGTLVGILTAKDCFRAALNASYYQGWSGIVSDFMTTNVETVDGASDLVSVAEKFLEREFRRFPVIEDGRLIGVITRFDLLCVLGTHLR